MSEDGIMIFMNEDGLWEKYDDTWDLVIHCESEEEHNEAVEWMKKSGAKKPIPTDFMGYKKCPNCDSSFDVDEEFWFEDGTYKYCPKCGQKIDWSE
jgi:hypothetical protein